VSLLETKGCCHPQDTFAACTHLTNPKLAHAAESRPHLHWFTLPSDPHSPYQSHNSREDVGLVHGVVIDEPISMRQPRVGVDLSRQDGAARLVVLEVRLQGRVVFGVVVAPVREHRGGRVLHQRDLPHRIHIGHVVPRRKDSFKLFFVQIIPSDRHGNFWCVSAGVLPNGVCRLRAEPKIWNMQKCCNNKEQANLIS
jgi:hypothetical protein